MTPEERENERYRNGASNPISEEEHLMFKLLDEVGRNLRILDVGCGVGVLALKNMEAGHVVTGIDFSSVAVELAAANGVSAEVVDVDKAGLPFDPDSFDVVWAGDIVEHVFDPINLLEESKKVVTPQGSILFSVPNDITLKRRLKIAIKGISPQTEVYRNYRQTKHHTVFSFELLKYFISLLNPRKYTILGLYRSPFTGECKVLTSHILSSFFAQTLIVKCDF